MAGGQQLKAWVQRAPRPMSSYTPTLDLEVSMLDLQQAHRLRQGPVARFSGYWGGIVYNIMLTTFRPPVGEVPAAPSVSYLIGATLNYGSGHRRHQMECAEFSAKIECLTGSAGVRTLRSFSPRNVAGTSAVLAKMEEWSRQKLQPYATGNMLRFRATLLKVKL